MNKEENRRGKQEARDVKNTTDQQKGGKREVRRRTEAKPEMNRRHQKGEEGEETSKRGREQRQADGSKG